MIMTLFKLKIGDGDYSFNFKFKVVYLFYHLKKKVKNVVTNYGFMSWIILRMKFLYEIFV